MLWMDSDDVPPKAMNLNYTKHAVHAIAERAIPVEWVERVVANPVLRVPDPNDPELERFFRRIPEYGDRALRVVVNTRVAPWRAVSVFFDRGVKGEL